MSKHYILRPHNQVYLDGEIVSKTSNKLIAAQVYLTIIPDDFSHEDEVIDVIQLVGEISTIVEYDNLKKSTDSIDSTEFYIGIDIIEKNVLKLLLLLNRIMREDKRIKNMRVVRC